MNNTVLANVARGIGAGLAATAAMSAVLGIAYKVKTIDRQPPQLIVDAFLPEIPERDNRVLAAVAHFGYGTAASIGYAVALPRIMQGVTTGTATARSSGWSATKDGCRSWASFRPLTATTGAGSAPCSPRTSCSEACSASPFVVGSPLELVETRAS